MPVVCSPSIANNGVVTVAGALDAENATSHSITIRATSSDTSFSTTTLSITVNDVDEFDVGPVTDSNAGANTVAEDAIVGTTVGITALATDADVTDNVTYSLSDDAGGRFAIDANTGVITVANALDYETATSHSVTVLATSSDTSTSSQVFTINVTDVNESVVGPVTDSNVAANTVAEDAIVGTTVGITALATDADVTDNVTYSLSNDAGGLFTIDANTGVITVANALDYETATSHSITVLATSSDGSTSSAAFTITVTDVNEGSSVGDDEDPETDEDDDSDGEDPTYEEPAEDPVAEDEPAPQVEKYLTPEDSSVLMKDPESEETEDIIYLTDENDADTQSEGRENDRSYIYFDNDLYKEITPENTLEPIKLTDLSIIDFENDDLKRVVANEHYDHFREDIDEAFSSEQQSNTVKTRIAAATMTTCTVGIISYLLRAGSLVTSLMSTLPLWRGFDPIAVFSGDKKKQKKQDEISDTDELKQETFFDGEAK